MFKSVHVGAYRVMLKHSGISHTTVHSVLNAFVVSAHLRSGLRVRGYINCFISHTWSKVIPHIRAVPRALATRIDYPELSLPVRVRVGPNTRGYLKHGAWVADIKRVPGFGF